MKLLRNKAHCLIGTLGLVCVAGCAPAKPAFGASPLSKWTAGKRAVVLVLNPASCTLSRDALA